MKRREAGAAVVLAILLVALAASTAALMLVQQDLWLRQAESVRARAQVDALARSAIRVVDRLLAASARVPEYDPVPEALRAARDFSIPGVALEITRSDPQARFNLNNLVREGRVSAADVEVFKQLLAAIGLAPELASALVDALDGDSETTLPGGAEDLDYLALQPPRLAGNRPFLDAAEIARVRGYTREAVQRLLPWVVALPEATPLNVNSASAEALMLIVPGLDFERAKQIVAEREEKPFTSMGAFRAKLPEGTTPASGVALDVTSRYLTLVSRVRSGNTQIAYEALIGLPGAARAGVIWRKQVSE